MRPELPLAGRARELQQLDGVFAAALGGHGSLVLVSGEFGSGKSRLAAEAGRRAQTLGLHVVWGHCDTANGAPTLWPWIEVLRALVANLGSCADASRVAPLAGIEPSIRRMIEGAAGEAPVASAAPDAAAAQFHRFDAVATLLQTIARSRALLLVLDDLHRADVASLQLLQFVAPSLRRSRIVVFGLHRSGNLHHTADFGRSMPALARNSIGVELSPLTLAEIAIVVGDAGWAPAVFEATEGNALLVTELVSSLRPAIETGDLPPTDLPLPERARSVLRERLRSLPSQTQSLLGCAAIEGRSFRLATVEHLARFSESALMAALGPAVEGGFIRPPSTLSGWYRFTHRGDYDVVNEDVPLLERRRHHARLAAYLAERYGPNSYRVAEVAHHFCEAGEEFSAQAFAYLRLAAQCARESAAHAEAAQLYGRALALAQGTLGTAAERCALLIARGEALRSSGSGPEALETFRLAAATARAQKERHLLARAAVGVGATMPERGIPDAGQVADLEEALAALPEDDSPLRCVLLGQLARALYFAPARERTCALAAEAKAMAVRLDDANSLAAAVHSERFVAWGYQTPQRCLELSRELLRVARQTGDVEMILKAHHWQSLDYLDLGELAAADGEIEALGQLADRYRLPLYRWFAAQERLARSLFDGRLAKAESQLQVVRELGAVDWVNAAAFALIPSILLCRETGRLAVARDAIAAAAREHPTMVVWRCGSAWVASLCDDTTGARAEVRTALAAGFARAPRDASWLAAVAMLAEACARLGERDGAELVYSLLDGHQGRQVVIGAGLGLLGSVDHYLGLTAATLRRWQLAESHFDAALRWHTRLRTPTYTVRTQLAWAAAVLDRGGEEGRAHRLLADAENIVAEHDLPALREEVKAWRTRHGDDRTVPAVEHAGAFAFDAGSWEVGFGDAAIAIIDTKGMRYIARLLAQPGMPVAAIELAAGNGGDESDSERARVNVSKAIATAIRRIRRRDERIGRYLATTIRTGATCRYDPDPRLAVSWRL